MKLFKFTKKITYDLYFKNIFTLGPILNRNIRLFNTSVLESNINLGAVPKASPSNNDNLSWYVSGLIDAEGSFGVNVIRKISNTTSYSVLVYFEIGLNKKDKQLLELVKQVLGVDNKLYYNEKDDTLKLKISNVEQLINNVIPHFKKYSLFTQKRADFILFTKVLDLIVLKKHLTIEGLKEVLSIKSSMNLGLSEKLAKDFLDIIPVERPLINSDMPNKNWLLGFIEGEACFYVKVYKSPKSKLNYAVQLVFTITQHIRDEALLLNICRLLECGRVDIRKSGDACDFVVTSLKEFKNNIVPYLNEYKLIGLKSDNCQDFLKVYTMMNNKDHLTEIGLAEIVKIKNNMNTKRL